jgi:hypothetical protein
MERSVLSDRSSQIIALGTACQVIVAGRCSYLSLELVAVHWSAEEKRLLSSMQSAKSLQPEV